ncbi:MAG: hypothetical protein IH621_18110, partial [Krumholzibacteria bacterium]|nr:hypothetical protein [Candidatus Krumholzibacteria bacterium]
MNEPAGTAVFLVLAPNWLGDAVMASPLLSRLAAARDERGQGPALHLAVRRSWAPLFAGDPAQPRVPVRVGYRGDGRGLLLSHPLPRPV